MTLSREKDGEAAIDAGANGPYVVKKLGLNNIIAVGELAKLAKRYGDDFIKSGVAT